MGGVEDENDKIIGTTFNQYCDYNKEPYQNLTIFHFCVKMVIERVGLKKWQKF